MWPGWWRGLLFKIGVEAFGSARAGHARPLQGGDGEMRDGGRFRRGVGTPPYARILSGGRRAASPLAAAKGLRRQEVAREG